MLSGLFRALTIDSWQMIDAEYRTRSLPDLRPAAVLLTVALSLVLSKYFGQERALDDYPALRALYSGVPWSSLRPYVHWGLFKLVSYGLLPWLCIAFVLRQPLSDFGVRMADTRSAKRIYLAMLAVVLPFVVAASFESSFLRTYPKYRQAGDSFGQFLSWELIYCAQFFLLEFFFRGFLIFALARYIGPLAIFVMVVPYAMIHFSKPFAECLGSILAGTALGTIALRTRSIWGGVLLHCVVGVGMDLLALGHGGKLQAWFGG